MKAALVSSYGRALRYSLINGVAKKFPIAVLQRRIDEATYPEVSMYVEIRMERIIRMVLICMSLLCHT